MPTKTRVRWVQPLPYGAAAHMREVSQRQELVSAVRYPASQLETLRALTAAPEVPWQRVIGCHMVEYLGISDEHAASFRRYLSRELVGRVAMCQFHEIDGNAADPEVSTRCPATIRRIHSNAHLYVDADSYRNSE
jgi:hypothetical protein